MLEARQQLASCCCPVSIRVNGASHTDPTQRQEPLQDPSKVPIRAQPACGPHQHSSDMHGQAPLWPAANQPQEAPGTLPTTQFQHVACVDHKQQLVLRSGIVYRSARKTRYIQKEALAVWGEECTAQPAASVNAAVRPGCVLHLPGHAAASARTINANWHSIATT